MLSTAESAAGLYQIIGSEFVDTGTSAVFNLSNEIYRQGQDFYGQTIIVEGSTFQMCQSISDLQMGGALFTRNCSVRISDTTLRTCEADNGGALYCEQSAVQITRVSFIECLAFDRAGAVLISQSTVQVDNTTFEGNEALADGAILAEGSALTIMRGLFGHNWAHEGQTGGIDLELANLSAARVVFARNVVEGGKSGAVLFGTGGNSTLMHCDFVANEIEHGKSHQVFVSAAAGPVKLVSCRFDSPLERAIAVEAAGGRTGEVVQEGVLYAPNLPDPFGDGADGAEFDFELSAGTEGIVVAGLFAGAVVTILGLVALALKLLSE